MAKINYKRLVALGCSHTYGHGLEDCFVPPYGFKDSPSELAWPSRLAKLLDIDTVINLSRPGCSNKYIVHTAMNFKFNPEDLITVLWTYNDRTTLFFDRNVCEPIAHWVGSKLSNKFIKNFYSPYDLNFQNSIFINYFNLYVKSLGYHYFCDIVDHALIDDLSFPVDSSFINVDFDTHRKKYGKALDQSHMNSQGHADFAKLWYEKIRAS